MEGQVVSVFVWPALFVLVESSRHVLYCQIKFHEMENWSTANIFPATLHDTTTIAIVSLFLCFHEASQCDEQGFTAAHHTAHRQLQRVTLDCRQKWVSSWSYILLAIRREKSALSAMRIHTKSGQFWLILCVALVGELQLFQHAKTTVTLFQYFEHNVVPNSISLFWTFFLDPVTGSVTAWKMTNSCYLISSWISLVIDSVPWIIFG